MLILKNLEFVTKFQPREWKWSDWM